jgi:hypothetical protein
MHAGNPGACTNSFTAVPWVHTAAAILRAPDTHEGHGPLLLCDPARGLCSSGAEASSKYFTVPSCLAVGTTGGMTSPLTSPVQRIECRCAKRSCAFSMLCGSMLHFPTPWCHSAPVTQIHLMPCVQMEAFHLSCLGCIWDWRGLLAYVSLGTNASHDVQLMSGNQFQPDSTKWCPFPKYRAMRFHKQWQPACFREQMRGQFSADHGEEEDTCI